ncbi:hypothetical protein SMB34_21280 [Thalassospira permensis NBRC 106175]|uniref:Uncharacterized protein n=1 Tax=Thalassospira permensis NBRC 106175 TaxID=1353532 RepID=A0ABR4TL32_9PROT|nr:hypothetical protein SMB34_21280 [Thalassospira permensis NBRC 106175]
MIGLFQIVATGFLASHSHPFEISGKRTIKMF